MHQLTKNDIVSKNLIVCVGLDRINRGGEVYARDLFNSLINIKNNVYAAKGGGIKKSNEFRLYCFDRNSKFTGLLAKLVGKSRVWIEYASFLPSLILLILLIKPTAIYCIEHPIYRILIRLRKLIPNIMIITHSGMQMSVLSSDRNTKFHYVTGKFLTSEGLIGEVKENDILIPHYIPNSILERIESSNRLDLRNSIRKKYGLNSNQLVVISVGNLDLSVKRMGWIAKELELDHNFFLLMVGSHDSESDALNKLCQELIQLLLGAFNGEVDSFYDELIRRVSTLQNQPYRLLQKYFPTI
jgi:hypothetical protein